MQSDVSCVGVASRGVWDFSVGWMVQWFNVSGIDSSAGS